MNRSGGQVAVVQGLGVSLFERLMGSFNGSIARVLTVQYRARPDAMPKK